MKTKSDLTQNCSTLKAKGEEVLGTFRKMSMPGEKKQKAIEEESKQPCGLSTKNFHTPYKLTNKVVADMNKFNHRVPNIQDNCRSADIPPVSQILFRGLRAEESKEE